MSQITAVEVEPVSHPLEEPCEISLGTQTEAKNILVTVRTAEGVTGIGEASPMPPVTGETQESAVAVAQSAATLVEGRECREYRAIAEAIRGAHPGMASVQFALEAAVLDARCRELGCALADVFGGPPRPVTTDLTIPIVPPAVATHRASDATAAGFEQLKIKTGGDVAEDVERVRAVRGAAPDAHLKVDANQGWTVTQTLRFLDELQAAGIELDLLEQPVRQDDVTGMAAVTARTSVPIAADETVFTPADAVRVVRRSAADVINVKLGKSGLVGAADIVSIAQAANVQLMVGCMLEGAVGIHTAAHLVAGTDAFDYVDLDGNVLLASDLVENEFGPTIDVAGPGHGIRRP